MISRFLRNLTHSHQFSILALVSLAFKDPIIRGLLEDLGRNFDPETSDEPLADLDMSAVEAEIQSLEDEEVMLQCFAEDEEEEGDSIATHDSTHEPSLTMEDTFQKPTSHEHDTAPQPPLMIEDSFQESQAPPLPNSQPMFAAIPVDTQEPEVVVSVDDTQELPSSEAKELAVTGAADQQPQTPEPASASRPKSKNAPLERKRSQVFEELPNTKLEQLRMKLGALQLEMAKRTFVQTAQIRIHPLVYDIRFGSLIASVARVFA